MCNVCYGPTSTILSPVMFCTWYQLLDEIYIKNCKIKMLIKYGKTTGNVDETKEDGD